jgi:hypothetical protein
VATNWPSSGNYWRVRKTKKAALPFANAGTDGSAGLYKAGQAPGLTTGATIASGYVGQSITGSVARASGVGLTSAATGVAIFNVGLTAGVWLLSGTCGFSGTATSSTQLRCAINTTNGATPTTSDFDAGLGCATSANIVLNNIDHIFSIPGVVVNLSASQTYYLNVYAVFAGGTCSAYGRIQAVRIA